MRKSQRQSSVRNTRSTVNDTATAPEREAVQAEPSAKTVKLIDGIRADFKAYVAGCIAFLTGRDELKAAFGRAFKAFKEDTGLGLAYFVARFDPSCPLVVRDYKKHKAYIAADYIMREVRKADRAAKAKAEGKTGAPRVVAATPLDGMARLIKSMLPLVSADQIDKLWELVEKELHWTDRQRESLKNRVEEADPLFATRSPRGSGGVIPQLRIAVPHGHRAGAGAEEEEPRTGTNG